MRKEIGSTKAQCSLSESEILSEILHLETGVVEIRENFYKVNVSVFCKTAGIWKIKCKNIYPFITYASMGMPAQITFEMLPKTIVRVMALDYFFHDVTILFMPQLFHTFF